MNTEIRNTLEKLAWLELYTPLEGTTKRLAEKMIRRTVRHQVAPKDNAKSNPLINTPHTTPPIKMPEFNQHKPHESGVPAAQSFEHKVASYKATYERS
jgi:hypothetical protein